MTKAILELAAAMRELAAAIRVGQSVNHYHHDADKPQVGGGGGGTVWNKPRGIEKTMVWGSGGGGGTGGGGGS